MFIWGASDFVFIGRYDQDKEKKQEAEFKSKYPYTWEAEMEETTEEEKIFQRLKELNTEYSKKKRKLKKSQQAAKAKAHVRQRLEEQKIWERQEKVDGGPGSDCKGKDSDILIHEGTFGVEDEDYAYTRKHSTTWQAVEVGKEMNARHTILTHFSSKFYRCPDFVGFPENVSIAFDNMQVRPSQLKHLHLMRDVLYSCLGSGIEIIKKRTVRKKHKRDLENEEVDEFLDRVQIMQKQHYVEQRMKDKEKWKLGRVLKSLKKTENEETEGRELSSDAVSTSDPHTIHTDVVSNANVTFDPNVTQDANVTPSMSTVTSTSVSANSGDISEEKHENLQEQKNV